MAKFNPKSHRKWVQKRSSFEDTIDEQLAKAGVNYAYESTTIPWVDKVSSGVCFKCGHSEVGQRRNYTPDFEVETGSGVKFTIEVKGYLDDEDRSKLRAIRKQYPDLDLRIVFQRDNRIPRTKEKTRYSAWAAKYGFKYAVGKVPEEWLT
jgi:hypothetical protein